MQAVNHTQGNLSSTDQLQEEHDLIMDRLEASRDAIRSNPGSVTIEITNLKQFLPL